MSKDLSRVLYGLQLEDMSHILESIEQEIYSKYNLINNPYARSYSRRVSIPFSDKFVGDNKIYEYLLEDKLLVMIYIRRNDFNTIDLYVNEYNIK